ncbi:pPIWI_RE_Z domain-containing protein [Streptosporangium saharense]|uniref:pPIWI_RE_Z domain-containing protein n=1 Tax=Streptosporangium saharense TaxID=1706840 RepID=UPI0036CC38A2
MRSTEQHLNDALKSVLGSSASREFRELTRLKKFNYRVELGLRLLHRLDSAFRPIDGWTLFGGYPFARVCGLLDSHDGRGEVNERMLRAARYHLEPMHRREVWCSALLSYLGVQEDRRAFHFSADLESPAECRDPSFAARRHLLYDALLDEAPPFSLNKLKPAEPGRYRFRGKARDVENITLPPTLPTFPQASMPTTVKPNREPFSVSVTALRAMARQMAALDEQDVEDESDNWTARFDVMELTVPSNANDGQAFAEAKTLAIDQMLHLIGIPGVGKSTLRDIIAAHAVTVRSERVVLVVGDVAEALRVVERFNRLKDKAQRRSQTDESFAEWAKVNAVPLIGSTARDLHLTRLHRRVNSRYPLPVLHDDDGFAFLSTACSLSALRGAESTTPLPYADSPCKDLRPLKRIENDGAEEVEWEEQEARRWCPLWGGCSRHDAARALTDATIWVATPESLAQSSLPVQQNEERLRYLEVACRIADLIIVDEADQVQIRLDRVFAPTATLYKRGDDSWLDRVARHNLAELAREGRIQLASETVEEWTAALDTVSTTANRIYGMLVDDEELREWVKSDLFSVWSLQLQLVRRWPATRLAGVRPSRSSDKDKRPWESEIWLLSLLDQQPKTTQETRDKRRKDVLEILDTFRDDPVGDLDESVSGSATSSDEASRLPELARRLVTNRPGSPHVARHLSSVLSSLAGLDDPHDSEVEARLVKKLTAMGRRRKLSPEQARAEATTELENVKAEFVRECRRFEFTLLLAVMHDRLNLMTMLWPLAESALKLSNITNDLYFSAPADFAPIIPESPMGNILAFQFFPDGGEEHRRTGELRFMRFAGVGRKLLDVLPALHTIGRDRGPNVLLMSGTSWAGASTHYHLSEPVGAVLRAKEAAGPKLPKVTLKTAFIYDEVQGAAAGTPKRPLILSGAGRNRDEILRKMVLGLIKRDPSHERRLSPFQQELEGLPIDRKRLLVLAGSYDDARKVAEILHSSGEWENDVCLLISDGDETTSDTASYDAKKEGKVPTLRRGELASFSRLGFRILVAPLMAVERGHNILNDQKQAAFGAVYFLARPFPHPGSIDVLIHALNDFTTRQTASGGAFEKLVLNAESLDSAGLAWRNEARRKLNQLAHRDMAWKRLSDEDREYLTWDLLVALWQVIGRLTRGGVDARVHFVDGAFATRRATGSRRDTTHTSLLVSMREVLAPYCEPGPRPFVTGTPPPHRLPVGPDTRFLATALYQPLYDGLVELLESTPTPVPLHEDRKAA